MGVHVVVAAGGVVGGIAVPDFSVVAGVPARVVRRLDGERWVNVPREH
jgi:acetyltransferase-like isoleucine patch superfamily enzyme